MVLLLVALKKCHQQLYKNILRVKENGERFTRLLPPPKGSGRSLWQTKGFIYEICIQAFYDRKGRTCKKRSRRKTSERFILIKNWTKYWTKNDFKLTKDTLRLLNKKTLKTAANPWFYWKNPWFAAVFYRAVDGTWTRHSKLYNCCKYCIFAISWQNLV